MKKSGAAYCMSKAVKTYLAMSWHRPHRAARRQAMIQAELFGAEVVRAKRDKDNASRP